MHLNRCWLTATERQDRAQERSTEWAGGGGVGHGRNHTALATAPIWAVAGAQAKVFLADHGRRPRRREAHATGQ